MNTWPYCSSKFSGLLLSSIVANIFSPLVAWIAHKMPPFVLLLCPMTDGNVECGTGETRHSRVACRHLIGDTRCCNLLLLGVPGFAGYSSTEPDEKRKKTRLVSAHCGVRVCGAQPAPRLLCCLLYICNSYSVSAPDNDKYLSFALVVR